MKRTILFLMVAVFATQLFAYEKLSLVERFTNASCAPCASINNSWYNATTQNLVNDEKISHLVYNVWWPGANDPMYLLNVSDNTVRTNYYGCNSVPWIEVNATHISNSQASLTSAVTSGNSQFAPFKIILSQEAFSENLIQIGVKIIRDPTDVTTFGNVKLRVSLTEKTVTYASPPGSNGESEFYSISRKMLPDASGTSFTVPAPGDTVELSVQYVPTSAFLAAVDLEDIRVVAFIQEDPSQVVYQSAMMEAIPNYVAMTESLSPDAIIENSENVNFSAKLYNVGFLDDSYYIDASMTSPNGWTGEYTSPNGTFEFGQQDLVAVATGDSLIIDLSVSANSINGFGEITLKFTSMNEPSYYVQTMFRMVTLNGVPGLVIDASGEGYGNVLIPGMDQAFGYPYGLVSSDALFPSIDLTGYTLISWSSGNALPVFSEDEVNALIPFLDNGGRLLINGQNIGQDIFDASGQSQFAQSFYNNYLHANYVDDAGLTFFFRGIDGDPISLSNLFSLSLNDLYSRSPDQFTPYDASASSLFTFGTYSQYNSIRADDGTNKVVYFGFGLEQVAVDTTRNGLVKRAINWLMDGIVLNTPEEELIVNTYGLEQNYPNPFNPTTTITYTIPNESQVSLVVYDIMGNEVTSLVNGKQSAGKHTVQFDASSLASGTYFYKLSADDFNSVKKMVLLK